MFLYASIIKSIFVNQFFLPYFVKVVYADDIYSLIRYVKATANI